MRILNPGGTPLQPSGYMYSATTTVNTVTADVWKAATNVTTAGLLNSFTMPQNNRLTYSGCDAVFEVDTVIMYSAGTITTGASGTMLNGAGDGDFSSVDYMNTGWLYTSTTQRELTLTDGDYIELGLFDNTSLSFTVYKFTVSARFKGYA